MEDRAYDKIVLCDFDKTDKEKRIQKNGLKRSRNYLYEEDFFESLDEFFYTNILNWGTYTLEEFAEISMMEPDGITPKPELKEVLAHPAMKSRIVDLGTIQYSHKVDEINVVENYYMWELEKRGGILFT